MAAKNRKNEPLTGKNGGRDLSLQEGGPVVVTRAEADRGHQAETSVDRERRSHMAVEGLRRKRQGMVTER